MAKQPILFFTGDNFLLSLCFSCSLMYVVSDGGKCETEIPVPLSVSSFLFYSHVLVFFFCTYFSRHLSSRLFFLSFSILYVFIFFYRFPSYLVTASNTNLVTFHHRRLEPELFRIAMNECSLKEASCLEHVLGS